MLEVAVIVLGLLWGLTVWMFVSYVRSQRLIAGKPAPTQGMRSMRHPGLL